MKTSPSATEKRFEGSIQQASGEDRHALPLPKTLIVDLSKRYGGSTSRVLALMMNSPHDQLALAGLQGGAVVEQARVLGLCVYVIGKSKLDLKILPHMIRLIREQGFSVIDSQNIQSKFWASMAALWTKRALVSTVHSWYTNEHGKSSWKGKAYTALELLTNYGLDLYITVSKKDRQALLNAGLPEDKIQLIYNAVKIDPQSIAGDGAWLRQKFNLHPDSIVCTAVGRLVPIKGYDVLIEAMRQIADDIPQLVLLIAGEGESKPALQNQIQRCGLGDRVHLIGYQDRESVLSILKACDLFAMSSHYEGTPIALLEAAALGRPILSTLTGGIPELVENGLQAHLVPPGDPHALSAGFLKLCRDRAYAHALGMQAQIRIQQQFNLDSQVSDTWDAYWKAMSRHRAAA